MIVCIQGLGFVGAAMAVAVAAASHPDGSPCFQTIGLDLPTPEGQARVAAIQQGIFPFPNSDAKLTATLRQVMATGRLRAVTDPSVLEQAAIVVVDVGLDLTEDPEGQPHLAMEPFQRAIADLGQRIAPGTLVVVETTVPPGTCDRVVAPLLAKGLADRGLPAEAFLLAHAYERVMPGVDYLDSIVNIWRVYAGHTLEAADACADFLGKVVNIKEFPLTRLPDTKSSETAKLLENSFRAVNIALMDEWSRFAEALNIDLFQVVAAIRRRPTHRNILKPGFGVGGYCLTKDPLLAWLAEQNWYGGKEDFPFCRLAVARNREMPLATVAMVRRALGGSMEGKRILLLGVSYRQDVADTRHAPSLDFVRAVRREGATVECHDPLVRYWPELDMKLEVELPDPGGFDVLVLAVPHGEYRNLDWNEWLGGARPVVVDANDCLSEEQRQIIRRLGCQAWGIGRGRW